MIFEGAWTAIVTPMMSDGAVDWNGLEKNLEFQIDQGITGLVPTGTTGESPTLSWDEHNDIVERTLKQAAGKCKVLPGTGSNSTQEAVESTEHAVELGASAALVVDCYYNGPSSLELRNEYYGVLAELFPQVSFVPYIIPGRSGTALSVEDLAILAAEHPNIHAVKEATGDMHRISHERKLVGPAFEIMSGDDDLTFAMMTDPAVKSQGAISVMSNVVPAAMSKMVSSILKGDLVTAQALQDAMSPLLGIVTVKVDSTRVLPNGSRAVVQDRFRNPLAIKTLMQALGMPSGPGRQPLGRMTAKGVTAVRSAAKKVWANNPEILAPIGEFYGVDVEARIAGDEYWNVLSYP